MVAAKVADFTLHAAFLMPLARSVTGKREVQAGSDLRLCSPRLTVPRLRRLWRAARKPVIKKPRWIMARPAHHAPQLIQPKPGRPGSMPAEMATLWRASRSSCAESLDPSLALSTLGVGPNESIKRGQIELTKPSLAPVLNRRESGRLCLRL